MHAAWSLHKVSGNGVEMVNGLMETKVGTIMGEPAVHWHFIILAAPVANWGWHLFPELLHPHQT